MDQISYESPEFYPLLEQVAPEVFQEAEDEQGLITGFAEQGIRVNCPINNLRTGLLNLPGYKIGTAFSSAEVPWPDERAVVHAQARTIIEDPDQTFAKWRATHALHVAGMQAELALRETVMEDEPLFLRAVPQVNAKAPEILVGNSDLLAIMQRTNGDIAKQLEQLMFDILRHLVLERRMSFADLYRLGR